jgi:hypoxanthine phosphoribosyltransferase
VVDLAPARSRLADTRFAHVSERELARLLDLHGLAWQYEPRTFVLDRDPDGRPTRAFTPDFYLPACDTYIELTTMEQRLVTRKNAKVRRLRQLHPDIDIRILYRRDYLRLCSTYGLAPPDSGAPVFGQ